jgi:hypothetical protein
MASYCGALACSSWLWHLQRLHTKVLVSFEERLRRVSLGFRLRNSRELICNRCRRKELDSSGRMVGKPHMIPIFGFCTYGRSSGRNMERWRFVSVQLSMNALAIRQPRRRTPQLALDDHPEPDASERRQTSAEASCWRNDMQLAVQLAIRSRGVVFYRNAFSYISCNFPPLGEYLLRTAMTARLRALSAECQGLCGG